jgi:hypothetical protein
MVAEATEPDFGFLISLVTIGFELITVFFGAFSTIFTGFVGALTSLNSMKNQEETP